MKVYFTSDKYNAEAEVYPTWTLFGIMYDNNHKLFLLDVAFLFFFRINLMVRKVTAKRKDAR